MAIVHFNVTAQSRKRGQTATAKAAYNAAVKVHDPDGSLHDYSKKGGVRARALVFAKPAETSQTREEFWQEVELAENRKDACVSREILGALPKELTYEQNKKLAYEFTKLVIARYGLKGADLAIHYPRKLRKPNAKGEENPHLHLLIPDRNAQGKKLRMFNKNPQEITDLRQLWEAHVNRHLEQAGVEARISLRTYKAQIQDLDREIAELKQHELNLESELARIREELANVKPNTGGWSFGRVCEEDFETGHSSGEESEAARGRGVEAGIERSAGGYQSCPGQSGSAAREGRESSSGRDTGEARHTGSATKRTGPTIHEIALGIAGRIEALRLERQAALSRRHKLATLAKKIASRLEGLRYERTAEYWRTGNRPDDYAAARLQP